jgi:hypothetical protein
MHPSRGYPGPQPMPKYRFNKTTHHKVEEGLNVSRRGYPATTAFSSLNPGIGGIDSVIAVGGVHKVKPCSEGTYSLMSNAS